LSLTPLRLSDAVFWRGTLEMLHDLLSRHSQAHTNQHNNGVGSIEFGVICVNLTMA